MSLKSVFIFILGFVSICSVYAQNYLQRFDGIPVTINGVNCISPYNGGIDQPRFQFIDIDGDGKPDLFIYDRDTSLNFYKNIGTINNPVFRLDSLKFDHVPVKNWFYFIDINHRGLIDLFTGGNTQSISFYQNSGTVTAAHYSLSINPVKTNTDSVIFSEAVCIPTFADIDADGDYDFFSGNSVGTVSYYKNIGTATNFNFQFITNQFAGIQIIGGAGSPGNKEKDNNSDEIEFHGASAITFAKLSDTTKLDLYWGDFFGKSVYRIKNTGTPQNFQWTAIDTFSPPPTPWISTGFNMPGVVDMNGDGKKDFFIGVIIGSVTKDNFIYYKNNGPVNNPLFSLVTKNFIPCIDVGSNSYPSFADVTGDGAPDLFIGSSDAKISYYKNTGTPFNPSFALVTDSLPILKTSFNYAPAFGDLDGDGKKDLLLGAFDGKLRYFKNTGTVQNPVFTFTASQFDAISVAQSSAPLLVDLNGDRLLDLLIGDSGGHIAYYRNDGDSVNFHFTLVNSQIPGIAVGNDAAPTAADIDGDGDKDLLIGNRLGKVFYYRNDGSASNPNFVLASNNYAGISLTLYAVPALVDINNDGDYDLFMGNIKGGLFYYENRDIIGVENIGREVPEKFSLGQNFPNPFNPETKIRFDVAQMFPPSKGVGGMMVQLKIYDAIGREVTTIVNQQLQPGSYETTWDGSKHASGIYYYRLTVRQAGSSIGDYTETRKMVLIK